MKFSRIDNVDKDHFIFEKIQAPFEWFFQDEIMMIPDPVSSPRTNWNKTVHVFDQEIECQGSFLAFFHFEIIEGFNFAGSLLLPEFEHIKQGIEIR